jgi:hypothetical protein
MRTVRLRRWGVVATVVVAAALGTVPAPAEAKWSVSGGGGGGAAATTLAAPPIPTATCEGAVLGLLPNAVRVTWTSPVGGNAQPTEYDVESLDVNSFSVLATIVTKLASTVRQHQFAVGVLNPGSYRFRVVAVRGNWRTPSPPSRATSITLLVCGLI